MSHRARVLVILLTIFASRGPLAQGAAAAAAPPAARLREAAALFSKPNWPAALAAYEALAKEYPRHAVSRFRMGVSLLELNRFTEAEAPLMEGERLGIPPGQAAYRLAQLYTELHRPDEAIAQLQRVVGASFIVGAGGLKADRHMVALHAHPKWNAIVDSFDALARPCMHDPRYREFDFWLGDWDVRPTGQPPVGPPARNTVTLEDNGCVVMEHWVAPSGSEGQSFNIYDRTYGVWRQTWVDNTGGQHDYRGSLKDGNMAFIGDTPAPGGKGRLPTKLTFFPIGKDSVRQFSEISNDGGTTWQVSYDLMYVRRRPQ